MSNFIQLGWTSHRKYHDVPLQPAYYQQVCKDVGKRGRSGKYSGKPGLPLRPEQGVSHEVSFGHKAEPVLEGDGTLPEEHAEAGGGGAALGAGDPVQGGFVCHDIILSPNKDFINSSAKAEPALMNKSPTEVAH